MALNVLATCGSASSVKSEINRRSADYHPSIWGDKSLEYYSSDKETNDEFGEKHVQQLKEAVMNMVVEAANNREQQLNLINEIQRLGLSYHFESQIEATLPKICVSYDEYCCSIQADNLHDVALCFGLLRQHGYRVSSDVFQKFVDSDEKVQYFAKDARAILSLFEAAQFRLHGEDILEKALSLTTFHLEDLKSYVREPLADEISHALKHPIQKELNRLGARYYISVYEKYECHNKLILDFAKFDFNPLQKMYQEELAHLTRWWKDLDFANKLPFARDT